MLLFARPSVLTTAVLASIGLLPATGLAAERSWLGAGLFPNWNDQYNWLYNNVPVSGDSVVFSGTLQYRTNIQNISDLVLTQLRFAPVGAFAASYTVNGVVRSDLVLNETTYSQTIDNLQNAESQRNFTVDNASPRDDAGAVYINTLAVTRYPGTTFRSYTATLKTGANGIVINQLTGGGNVIVDGPGYVSIIQSTLAIDPTRPDESNFSGSVVVNNGTLVVGGGYQVGSNVATGPTNVRLAAGTNLNFDDNSAAYRTISSPNGYATLRTRGTELTSVRSTFSGSFVKAGTGTLELERFTDGTNFSITQGSLAIKNSPENYFSSVPVNLGTVNIESGTSVLQYNYAGLSVAALTGTGSVDLATGYLALRPSGYTVVTPLLFSGGGRVVMDGTGVADIRRVNTYSAGTDVYNGKLVVSADYGALGSGDVNVYGGTLAGTGRVSGKVFVKQGGTIAPSRADSPGLNTGTFTVAGLDLTAGGSVGIEFNGITQGTQVDLLAVNNGGAFGDANITGGILNLSRGTNFFPASGKFPKVSILKTGTSGSLTGVFASINGVRVNDSYSFAVTYDAQNVYAQLADVSDTNLDNTQNYLDLYALAGSYKKGTLNQTWVQGDLSGDGTVNYTDLLLVDSYVPELTKPQFDALLPQNYALWYDYGLRHNFSVPEPASLAVLSLAGVMLGRRRRV